MIKKKDLSEKDLETWETYIKNPSDVYDKEKNNQKNQFTKNIKNKSPNWYLAEIISQ